MTLTFGRDTGICPDPLLTVHVLSRLAGPLYVPSRKPTYDWDTLFGEAFVVDTPSLIYPSIRQPPWKTLLKGLP